MSLALVSAVFLLARAEAGELASFKQAGHGNGKLVTVSTLKALRAELKHWQLADSVVMVLEWIERAGLVVRDEAGLLRPTASGYTWLQLPTALSHRLLFESSHLADQPLFTSLVSDLANNKVRINHDNEAVLTGLELFGLVQFSMSGQYQLVSPALALLTLLSHEASLDEAGRADLAYQWQLCYPGGVPSRGWLKWQPELFCFSFARLPTLSPLPFDAWQLFRLVTLSRPETTSEETNRFYCKPTARQVGTASLAGVEARVLLTYLNAGLNEPLPAQTLRILNGWLTHHQPLQVRELIVLEAQDRAVMQKLMEEPRLRSYLARLLSPRFAIIQRGELGRLRQLLERRGYYLKLDVRLAPLAQHNSAINIGLLRSQVQLILAGLLRYRREQVAQGYEVTELDKLLTTLEATLSRREQQEVDYLAADSPSSSIFVETQTSETPGNNLIQLRQQLEQAIGEETEIFIEYSVPGKGSQKRQIEPLALYEQAGQYYLTAYCQLRRAQRTFRLDRLTIVKKLGAFS